MKNKKSLIFIIILIVGLLLLYMYNNNINNNEKNTENNSNNNDNTNSDDESNEKTGDFKITGGSSTISGNKVTITASGVYTLSGTLNGYIEIKTNNDVTLKLNNVIIKNDNGPAISGISSSKLTIIVEDGTENTLTDSSNYSSEDLGKATIFSNDPIIIEGTGTLNVIGNYKHGIASDDNIIIKSSNININAKTDGIHVNDNVEVNGGILTIKSASDGIESEDTITVNGGTFNIAVSDDGISAAGNLTINGGTFNISKCEEGIESKNKLIINGGTFNILANDDGLNATSDITINNGTIYVNSSKGDAIDSNGTLTINDGLIIALGAGNPEAGIDNDNTGVTINGGTLIATGGNNSPIKTSSKQASVSLGSVSSGKIINIVSGDNTIFTYKVEKSFSSLMFSSPLLTIGNTYSVYSGGTVSGGTENKGIYSNSIYSGGTLMKTFTTSSVFTNAGGTIFSQGGGGMR